MIGLGTLINTVAVIAGGLLGMGLKKGVADKFQKILMPVFSEAQDITIMMLQCTM